MDESMTDVVRNVMAALFLMIALFAVVCLMTGGGPLQSPAALMKTDDLQISQIDPKS